MKRNLSFVVLGICSIVIVGLLISAVVKKSDPINKDPLPSDTSSGVGEITGTGTTQEVSPEAIKQPISKIEQLKLKHALRGLIYEGNSYYDNEQYALALKSYLDVYAKTEDNKTAEKIANTYFEMKKFSDAHKYYSIIKAPDTELKAFLSLLYHKNIDIPENITSLMEELKKFTLSQEQIFFYKRSLECVQDFGLCITNFEKYFQDPQHTVTSLELKEIQITFTNYKNFKLEDTKYRDALIIGSFYKLGLYPIVIKLGKDLLGVTPDYKPMILMIAQSYFELGDYKNAKVYLEKYKTLTPEDKDVTYLLGVLYLRDHDYVLSNIHLNKALELNYEPAINVKRRLLYTYEKLDQDEKLLREFEKLIKEEPGYEREDAYLAIYYHIINDKLDIALELSRFALKKLGEDGNIYGYMGWIYRDMGEIEKAKEVITKGLKLDGKNTLLNLNMGLIFVESGEPFKAIIYFKQVIRDNENGEFGKKAKEELEKIGVNQ